MSWLYGVSSNRPTRVAIRSFITQPQAALVLSFMLFYKLGDIIPSVPHDWTLRKATEVLATPAERVQITVER